MKILNNKTQVKECITTQTTDQIIMQPTRYTANLYDNQLSTTKWSIRKK